MILERGETMNNKIEKIQNKMKNFLGNATPENHPFLNKYFWNTDMRIVCCSTGIEQYNKSILILDDSDVYNDEAYIFNMERYQLSFLSHYFRFHPIHHTNRISVVKEYLLQREYQSLFETLISTHVKPEIIITFSKNVGKTLKSLFEIKLESHLKNTGFWKGFMMVGERYFFVYCLPEIDSMDIMSNHIEKYIMSSRSDEFQTCSHLNEIVKKDAAFQFPNTPLDDDATMRNLRQLEQREYISLLFSHPRDVLSELATIIEDFDEYDFMITRRLSDCVPESDAIHLSKSDYLEARKTESSESLCHRYFDQTLFKYLLYTSKLALIQLYLYSNYPQESFDLIWNAELQCNAFANEMHKDALTSFNKFKPMIIVSKVLEISHEK